MFLFLYYGWTTPFEPFGNTNFIYFEGFLILYSLALRDYITSESPFQFVFFYHLCFMLETLLQCLEIFGLFIFNRMHWKSQFGRSLACRRTSDENGTLELPFYHSSPILPAPKMGSLPTKNLQKGIIKSRRKPNWDLIVSQAFGRGFALRIT